MARNPIAIDWTSRVRIRIYPIPVSRSSVPGSFFMDRTPCLLFTASFNKCEIKGCPKGVSFSFNKMKTRID